MDDHDHDIDERSLLSELERLLDDSPPPKAAWCPKCGRWSTRSEHGGFVFCDRCHAKIGPRTLPDNERPVKPL